ncbi:MAG: hypothetical protein ACRDZ3_11180 [Acidimicrobiia bacterium]
MKYQRTDSFVADYKRLTKREQKRFKEAGAEFKDACDANVARQQPFPQRLRVKQVQGAPGIFEMTWSFSGPDGRATFEWTQVEVREAGRVRKEPAVLWRRVGGHEVFKNP